MHYDWIQKRRGGGQTIQAAQNPGWVEDTPHKGQFQVPRIEPAITTGDDRSGRVRKKGPAPGVKRVDVTISTP